MHKTYRFKSFFFLIFTFFFFSDCTKDDPTWSLEKILPKVKTLFLSGVSASSASVGVEIAHNGGYEILEKGVCYSLEANPTIENGTKVISNEDEKIFTVSIQNITELKTYYVRAFAKNKKGISYGETLQFTTKGLGKVTTLDASNINFNSATLNGTATSTGDGSIVFMGFLVGEEMEKIDLRYNSTRKTLGNFVSIITDLKPLTTYYYKAFLETTSGTSFGEIKSFKTISTVIPTVSTQNPVQLSPISFTCIGNVTSAGSSPVTSRGICYSNTPSPTISSNFKNGGSGVGQFSATIDQLEPGGVTYYIRAYATNIVGTAYGNQVTFTTGSCNPTLSTVIPSNITQNSASSGGTITSNGGFNITSKGVIWSTSQNPTISLSTKTNIGTGSGNFTSQISGLSPNTRYYVRAYATNSCGTEYGNQVSFTTTGSNFIGTVTIGNGTSVEAGTSNPVVTPFGTYYSDTRHLYLIRASEIQNAGGASGNISDIYFNVTSSSNININNFFLRVGSTSDMILDENNSYSFQISTTYSSAFNLASIGTGWIEFPLSGQFSWNGTSNIVIEVCFDNISSNQNSLVRYSNTGFKSNLLAFRDNSSGCNLTWIGYALFRPNIRLKFE